MVRLASYPFGEFSVLSTMRGPITTTDSAARLRGRKRLNTNSQYLRHVLAQGEDAAALTERAIEANGDDYNTFIPFGNALERLGRKKEAEDVRQRMTKVLRQQLELVPEDVRARVLLSSNLAYTGEDADESIRHLQTAVALRPGHSNILYNAACTYGVLGRKAEALETLKKAFAAGYANPAWAAKDSDLKLLHDDPEFRKLVGLEQTAAS